jgi:hypothetical protein
MSHKFAVGQPVVFTPGAGEVLQTATKVESPGSCRWMAPTINITFMLVMTALSGGLWKASYEQ